MTSNGALIVLMGFLFLFFGYMGVPVAFALIASVLLSPPSRRSASPR